MKDHQVYESQSITTNNERAYLKMWFKLFYDGMPIIEGNILDTSDEDVYVQFVKDVK